MVTDARVIHSDPDILGGTPVFVGTRVPVRTLIDYLESGDTLETFLNDFPSVSRELAIEALEMATRLLFSHAHHASLRSRTPAPDREPPTLDALERVERWREVLRQFFVQVRRWCQALPEVSIAEEPLKVDERASGEYEVSRLVVLSAGREMTVQPIGAWVVGFDGMVDLRGPGGPIHLLYQNKENNWFVMDDELPFPLRPLTEARFLDLAEGCLDG